MKRVQPFPASRHRLSWSGACSQWVPHRPRRQPRYAGPTEQGFLLPNGWTLNPAGRPIALADLPLNIIALADNRHALAATSGYNAHELSLIDLQDGKVVDHQAVSQSWFGLAANANGRPDLVVGRWRQCAARVSAGGWPAGSRRRPRRPKRGRRRKASRATFARASPSTRRRKVLYSLDIDAGTISALDLADLKELKSAPAGTRPYDVVLSRSGNQLFVSDWAGRAVRVVDPGDLRTVARIAVGEHPNQIAVSPTDDRIFVACASSNCVSVIDTRRGVVTETIHTSLFPRAPEGSTPDALAVAPDGKTLFVANADNNNIAVIDIATPSRSQVKGFIPTGWYPTAVAITPDGKQLLVGVGKGNQTKANPIEAEKPKSKSDSDVVARPRQSTVPLHRHDALGFAVDRAGAR